MRFVRYQKDYKVILTLYNIATQNLKLFKPHKKMPTIFRTNNPEMVDNQNQDTFRKSTQRNHQYSLREDQEQSQSYFDKFLNALSLFNLCLRPERQSKKLTEFLENYEVVSLYHDPYYGECYALQSKQVEANLFSLRNNRSFFTTSFERSQFRNLSSLRHFIALSKQKLSKDVYQARKDFLEEISKYSGSEQNVLGFTIIADLEKQQFMFKARELYIAYDFILVDLEKQFENRIISKKEFTESEINVIMKECCNGLVALENTNYHSIRMAYVYFCRIGRQIKVAHPKMFKYLSNLETVYEDSQAKGIYLSPEQVSLLEKNDISESSLKNIGELSNSFTFGMLILSLMCHKYLNEIYDYRSCEINYQKIRELLNNLTNHYSERLLKIIQKLLAFNQEDRLSLRSLLNVLEEKHEMTQNVQITLLKDKAHPKQDSAVGYQPLFEEEPEEPKHKNYLYGMVYPKVGNQAEYYHFLNNDPLQTFEEQKDLQKETVVASSRINYGSHQGKYIGESLNREELGEHPLKEGKGIYLLPDGQAYVGEWKNNQMSGYGKLYWPGRKIRYEGQFQNGKFEGFGTEYSQFQLPQTQREIDKTFVRMHKGSWLKYEGRFKNDLREGPGKAYFKTGKWIGNFKNGQPGGHGVWEDSNGQKLRGIWQDGYLTSIS